MSAGDLRRYGLAILLALLLAAGVRVARRRGRPVGAHQICFVLASLLFGVSKAVAMSEVARAVMGYGGLVLILVATGAAFWSVLRSDGPRVDGPAHGR